MNEKFTELIKLIKLGDIRIVDSHETVDFLPSNTDSGKLEIQSEQAFLKDDPVFQDATIVFHPKYKFSFSIQNNVFFKCEYIFSVCFTSDNIEKVKQLLEIEDVKKLLVTKQLNRTLWSVLRGVVMDAFNRHSLRPAILPWVL